MRKGISFTLTIIITAVVLMTAALTLVTLFGSSIGNFFGTVSGTGVEASIKQRCSSRMQRVSDKCSEYYNEDEEGEAKFRNFRQSPDYTETCNDQSCDIGVEDNEITVAGVSTGISATVEIQGDEYDCQDEGYISSSCPVDVN